MLTVTSIDKHPASAGFHFGVDRLSLEATSGVRTDRREAMRALDWLLTHPADCFDGGSVAVAGEILALKRHTRAAGLVRVSRALPRRLAARVVAQSGEKVDAARGALDRELIDDRRLLPRSARS